MIHVVVLFHELKLIKYYPVFICQALFTASKMSVFDVLQSKPGLDAAQVAQEIKASVKGTECLLEACASLQLLKSKERS